MSKKPRQSPQRKLSNGKARKRVKVAARFKAASASRKLAPNTSEKTAGRSRPKPGEIRVACTYASPKATCSRDCRFWRRGCFAQAGYTGRPLRMLDEAASGLSPEDVVREEIRQTDDAFGGGPIPRDGARGGRDLRLHVGGDVGSAAGARLLAKLARRWRCRGGGTVWTSTHYWRCIPRSAWGDSISALASVETAKEIEQAAARGYAAILVVEDFPNGPKAFRVEGSTRLVVPCPGQTHNGITCVRCRLCLDRDLLKIGRAIGVKTHGPGKTAANEALRAGQTRRPPTSARRKSKRRG
jgi:hypothetical protein